MLLQRVSRNQSQFESFSASTTAKARGNNCPITSTPVAARRMPIYLLLRCVPSSPRSGWQYVNPDNEAPKPTNIRLNFDSSVLSMKATVPGLVLTRSSQYLGSYE